MLKDKKVTIEYKKPFSFLQIINAEINTNKSKFELNNEFIYSKQMPNLNDVTSSLRETLNDLRTIFSYIASV